MRDELLHYYERELAFLRKSASEFAERYPEVAGRLMIEPTKCEDPHVERIIESVAMMFLGELAPGTFDGPHGLVFDDEGSLYVGDTGWGLIRKFSRITEPSQ